MENQVWMLLSLSYKWMLFRLISSRVLISNCFFDYLESSTTRHSCTVYLRMRNAREMSYSGWWMSSGRRKSTATMLRMMRKTDRSTMLRRDLKKEEIPSETQRSYLGEWRNTGRRRGAGRL